MSGVALRCPNCGTTQSGTGECEACHEAAVRYFCTNHSPGRWLDGAACPACGSRFGEVRPAPRATPVPPPPRAAPSPSRAAPPPSGPRPGSPPTRKPAPARPEPPVEPSIFPPARPSRTPWVRRAPPPSEPREPGADFTGADRDPFRRHWPDLLRSRMRRSAPPPGYEMEARPLGSPLRGCRGLFLLGLLLIGLLFVMGLSSAGPLLQILLQILLSQ